MLNVKSREEHEVLQAAELSAKLIQRTTSEAPHRLRTSLDWMFTKKTISYCVKDTAGRVHQEGLPFRAESRAR